MRLSEIGEFGFIDRIAPLGLIRPEHVVRGIGDDCAVIELDATNRLLITTDLLVERVHFHKSWSTPNIVGRKALAVNISDIAACGGIPRDAFVSIAVPEDVELEWLESFYQGMASLAREFDINIVGGDTTRSRADLVINIALTGIVHRDEVLLRNTAQPGDIIVLTGPTGQSAAGCEILLHQPHLPDHLAEPLTKAHLDPRPHVKEGRFLAASHCCSAAIDLSDGLSSDLGHICSQSGIGALLYEDKIPLTEALSSACRHMGRDPLDWVLNGGEDYILIAAIQEESVARLEHEAKQQGIDLFPIGILQAKSGVRIVRRSRITEDVHPRGWNHFMTNLE